MWSNVVLFYSPYIISGRMCSLLTKITLNTAGHLIGWCTMLHLPVSSRGGGERVGGGWGGGGSGIDLCVAAVSSL